MSNESTRVTSLQTKVTHLALLMVAVLTTACVTPLSVRRHQTVGLTDARATTILSNFSNVVFTADTPNDFACTTGFNNPPQITDMMPAIYPRSGAVGTYAANANFNSAAAAAAILGTPGYVKVVNNISWCSQPGANIIGCSPTPGTSMAVVRWTAALEGILWAHEFGHTVGLPHRNNVNAIMNPFIVPTALELTAGECVSFVSRAINNPFNTSGIVTGDPAPGMAEKELVFERVHEFELAKGTDVVDFVHQTYVHGTPTHLAARFEGTKNAQTLAAMLGDTREYEHAGNIVYTLGVIGSSRDVSHVTKWLDTEQSREADWTTVQRVNAGMLALAHLANRTGSPDAIDYLVKSALVSYRGKTNPEIEDALADSAAVGLAMVGTKNSLVLLDQVYSKNESVGRKTSPIPFEELVDLNLDIQELGIDGYYAP